MKKKLVVLTGAGVSAESGISTFRDSDGLWENYKVEEVASIDGWFDDPKLVLEFYNARRAQLATVKPNSAHYAIAELEKDWQVTVVTQNVDNLHERAGSTKIIHLHGELVTLSYKMVLIILTLLIIQGFTVIFVMHIFCFVRTRSQIQMQIGNLALFNV